MGVQTYGVPAVAAIFLFASEAGHCQELDPNSLRQKLVEVRLRILRSSGTMRITIERYGLNVVAPMSAPPPGERPFVSDKPPPVTITTTWAFRGGQTYEARGEQWQQLFDGSRWLSRSIFGDHHRGWIGTSPRNPRYVPDPIEVGYRVSGLLSASTAIGDVWLCEIFRFVRPSVRATSDKRIEMSWKHGDATQKRATTVILNPAKGYLIEECRSITDRVLVIGGPSQFGKSESIAKIIASTKLGEIWIPSSIEFFGGRPGGPHMLNSVIRVDQMKNGVEQSRFDRFFQTGDVVRENSQYFVMDSEGTLQPTNDPGSYSRRGSSFVNRYMMWVGGLAGAIVLAFALFKGMAFVKAKKA